MNAAAVAHVRYLVEFFVEPRAKVKDSILTSLKARQKSKATRDLLDTLRAGAKIEVLEPGVTLDAKKAPIALDGKALPIVKDASAGGDKDGKDADDAVTP